MINKLIKKKDEILKEFKCQGSGNCCKTDGYVYVTQSEITDMSKLLTLSIDEFREKYVIKNNGWDVIASITHRPNCFLDKKNRCTVYKARPIDCRTYPDWPEIWETDVALVKETTLCPGLKKAVNKISENN